MTVVYLRCHMYTGVLISAFIHTDINYKLQKLKIRAARVITGLYTCV